MSLNKLMVAVLFSLSTTVFAQAAEPSTPNASIPNSGVVQKHIESVNINQAGAEEIAGKLKGIGEAKARAIVDYRNRHGAFSSAAELTRVKGIGNAIIEKNRGRILL